MIFIGESMEKLEYILKNLYTEIHRKTDLTPGRESK